MQKQQIFYIHGGEAFSDHQAYLEHLKTMPMEAPIAEVERPRRWTDSLRSVLGEAFEVFTPTMPNKYNAKYEEWKIWFERHIAFLRDDLVLIGWSQGGYFLAKYLIENEPPVRIKALFLVAAPYEAADFGGEDGGDFAFDTNRVGELTGKVEKIYILHSQDDFVVPHEHARKYQAALPEAELITFADKNHFLIPEFPELIDLIKKL